MCITNNHTNWRRLEWSQDFCRKKRWYRGCSLSRRFYEEDQRYKLHLLCSQSFSHKERWAWRCRFRSLAFVFVDLILRLCEQYFQQCCQTLRQCGRVLRQCGQVLRQCGQVLQHPGQIFEYFDRILRQWALKFYITFTLTFWVMSILVSLAPSTALRVISPLSTSTMSVLIYMASITLAAVLSYSHEALLSGIAHSVGGPTIDQPVMFWMLIQCVGITLKYSYGTPTFASLPIDFLVIFHFGWVSMKALEKFFAAMECCGKSLWYRIPCLLVLPIAIAANFGGLSPIALSLVNLLGLILVASIGSLVVDIMLFMTRLRHCGTILAYSVLCAWAVILTIQIYGLLSFVAYNATRDWWPDLGLVLFPVHLIYILTLMADVSQPWWKG